MAITDRLAVCVPFPWSKSVPLSSMCDSSGDKQLAQNHSHGRSALLGISLLFQPILPASAADYNSYLPEQRFISEAWRKLDNAYIDRTFNHQNWFELRQDAMKKKYKNMDGARTEVERIMSSLGDRYTRYLPPAKHDSIVNAATGNVFVVGVELAQCKEGMRVIPSHVEPDRPAAEGGVDAKGCLCGSGRSEVR